MTHSCLTNLVERVRQQAVLTPAAEVGEPNASTSIPLVTSWLRTNWQLVFNGVLKRVGDFTVRLYYTYPDGTVAPVRLWTYVNATRYAATHTFIWSFSYSARPVLQVPVQLWEQFLILPQSCKCPDCIVEPQPGVSRSKYLLATSPTT
jgi:hypothetical protein